jgi:AraC-like DNA-binding protein
MGLIHRITRRPLADFVDFLWLSEGYAQAHSAERVLPTGSMSLVLSLEERGASGNVFSGARTRSFILDTSRPLSMMGVGFRPGGGAPFFQGPAVELRDLSVGIDELWGAGARELRDRLLEARGAPARFRVLERFLLGQVRRAPDRNPAVGHAIHAFQRSERVPSVADVTARTGFSARRFIEMFRNEVGMTPKVFSRLCRFRAAVDFVAARGGAAGAGAESAGVAEVRWADIAMSCGYFDQAHFIHDFREFAGVSPTAYLRHRMASRNHLRVPADAR